MKKHYTPIPLIDPYEKSMYMYCNSADERYLATSSSEYRSIETIPRIYQNTEDFENLVCLTPDEHFKVRYWSFDDEPYPYSDQSIRLVSSSNLTKIKEQFNLSLELFCLVASGKWYKEKLKEIFGSRSYDNISDDMEFYFIFPYFSGSLDDILMLKLSA